ncbi:hypothetical protein E4T39_08061 [Aureobasidium subglaciale]|nr:hypothetical protein E4T39_08061 [Aureobasidium subglaciale]
MHHHQTDLESLHSRNSTCSNSNSGSSNQSRQSHSTQGTQYSGPSSRPPFVHYETCEGRLEGSRHEYCHQVEEPRSSTETYASTVPSEVDDDEDFLGSDGLCPLPRPDPYGNSAIPSTPSDFAELFPSERLLSIRHDDATPDGNMNLRIDTVYEDSGCSPVDVTLFHLRMHDLKARQFSLRRYCRESGREVCHSIQKCQKSGIERRMSIQKSLSNAFASLRSIADHKASRPSASERLKRSDSGYESLQSRKSIDLNQQAFVLPGSTRDRVSIPTKTIKLEFSNYAQVEIKRCGSKSSKRYEFEYWGVHYAWRRIVNRIGAKQISFCLFRNNEDRSLARILPIPMSGMQQREELSKGGWVPPCTMDIVDEEIIQNHSEISDVVVAAGLIALVDDCIKRRFHIRPARGVVIPIPKFRLDMEYMGSKRQGGEHAGRPSTRGSTANRRPTPLRKGTCDV